MENNTLQIEITEQDEKNEVLISMHKELDSLNISLNENWCIYKVPEIMLKGHDYFYQPVRMSIGPVFYKDPKLETMQKVKWIYLNSFLQHPNNKARQSLNPYIEYVRGKEEEIRKCYEQEFKLCSDEFVKMIVLDAAFLVYFFMGGCNPLFGDNLNAQLCYVVQNLLRLENQIPYFVIKGIYDIAFDNIYEPTTLMNATLTFIYDSNCIPGSKAIDSIVKGNKITNEISIKHLVDLQWMCCKFSLRTPLRNQPRTNPTADSDSNIHCRFGCAVVSSFCNKLCQRHRKVKTNDGVYYIRHLCYTAKQLIEAGVTFVEGEPENPFDVTFDNGKLTISNLALHDNAETYLRNLVYFEQCHYYRDSYLFDYIVFMDELIDTVEDVQVLVKSKILSNGLGSDPDVVNLFNNLGKYLAYFPSEYNYAIVSREVNHYASTRRHRWMAILRRNYLNHPWVILSVIAAFILFVLTLLQTTAAFIYK